MKRANSAKQPWMNWTTSATRPSSPSQAVRLTPYAWAKLVYLRDRGSTEIGGFGISSIHQPLLIEDVRLVRQRCDWASVALDDAAVADFFDEQVEAGRRPGEFGRVWVHTHPGDSPLPSLTDEETFERVFGACDWAVMLIAARGGKCFARIRFRAGPGGQFELPVEIDYDAPFGAADHAAWQAEYDACVEELAITKVAGDVVELFGGDYPRGSEDDPDNLEGRFGDRFL